MGQAAMVFKVKGIILENKNNKPVNQEVRKQMTTEMESKWENER